MSILLILRDSYGLGFKLELYFDCLMDAAEYALPFVNDGWNAHFRFL